MSKYSIKYGRKAAQEEDKYKKPGSYNPSFNCKDCYMRVTCEESNILVPHYSSRIRRVIKPYYQGFIECNECFSWYKITIPRIVHKRIKKNPDKKMEMTGNNCIIV